MPSPALQLAGGQQFGVTGALTEVRTFAGSCAQACGEVGKTVGKLCGSCALFVYSFMAAVISSTTALVCTQVCAQFGRRAFHRPVARNIRGSTGLIPTIHSLNNKNYIDT